jgi:hypothetical protein
MVTIPGFLSDPSKLSPLAEKTQGGRFADDVFSHLYNADLAKCLKQVLVTVLLDIRMDSLLRREYPSYWKEILGGMTEDCDRNDGLCHCRRRIHVFVAMAEW